MLFAVFFAFLSRAQTDLPFEKRVETERFVVWSDVELPRGLGPVLRSVEDLVQNQRWLKWTPKRVAVLVRRDWDGPPVYSEPGLQTPDELPAFRLHKDSLKRLDLERLLIHELVHVTHYALRAGESRWLQEEVALWGEYLTLRTPNPLTASGYAQPETSLISDLLEPSQYGLLTLFSVYLHRWCGGEDLFEALLSEKSAKRSWEFLDEVLQKKPQPTFCATSAAAFSGFATALHEPNYSSNGAWISATTRRTPVRTKQETLPPYSSSRDASVRIRLE